MSCRRLLLLLVSIVAAGCLGVGFLAPAAGAATGDPLLILRPEPKGSPFPIPPPFGQFDGPCGVGVDGNGNFYISDYHHHVIDVYSRGAAYSTQLAAEDPLDGPCGLALGPSGDVYVNNYHRNVVRFGAASNFGSGVVIAGVGADATHPTGVAVDGSGTVFVDERDRVATFDSAGSEGEPIGAGNLLDGYGVAVSVFPATAGFVYVPDASTETVKVFDPATSRLVPVAEIDGSATPHGHFASLRDASVAVDNSSGTIYVVDDLTPEYTEGHEAVVYAFGPTGSYLGRLKYSIQTALPAGLAVDNSGSFSQGRVYVTSGYTELAEVYAYPPGSAGTAAVPLTSLAARGLDPASVTPAASPDQASAVVSGPANTTSQASVAGASATENRPKRKAHRGRRRHQHRLARGRHR